MRQHGTTLGIATVSSLRAHRGGVAKSLPPPPPLAAYVQRTDRPAPDAQATPQAPSPRALPALPNIVQTPNSDWFETSGDHFGASVRAPKPVPRGVGNWGKIIAGVGIGAVAVLGAGFAAGLVSRPFHNGPVLYSERPTSALASAQHSAWVAKPKTQIQPVRRAAAAVSATPTSVAPAAPKVLLPAALVLPPLAALPAAPSPIVDETAVATTAHLAHHAKVTTSTEHAAQHSESNTIVVAAADKHPAAVETTTEDLPVQPTREQIKDTLTAIRPALEACSANAHGTMFANLNITSSGRVAYSNIEGAFAGSAEGSCMARALRTAEFPRFASASLKVRYPFVL